MVWLRALPLTVDLPNETSVLPATKEKDIWLSYTHFLLVRLITEIELWNLELFWSTYIRSIDQNNSPAGKSDEGYLVGYASNSKAYRVYNLPHKRVDETLNLIFFEDKPNVQGIGHEWYFDLDYLTDSLGYTRFKTDIPAGTQETNINAGTQDHDSDLEVDEQVIVVPSFPSNSFAGPSSSNGPSVMERNADYAEELDKLQRQEYEAKNAWKSTTGGCQFLGRRLISWQCKKQTIVATSSTEAEYVAAASCCAQVLWIQNQLLDYGFNFMNTKIFIDNQSTILIGTDKSKITRKQSKASKHGHENQKSTKKPSLSQSLSKFSSPRAILAFLQSYL
ncbi:retrovirus-related pol polyprotein from transposon TNT 1-94 [Tanacetum coccineum]